MTEGRAALLGPETFDELLLVVVVVLRVRTRALRVARRTLAYLSNSSAL